VEGPSLEELAKGKREAVIVFDDMTRPTPVKRWRHSSWRPFTVRE
jgi:nickel-dependent lactate racemase